MPRSYARRYRPRRRTNYRRKRPYRKTRITKSLFPRNMVHSFTRSIMPDTERNSLVDQTATPADGWVDYLGIDFAIDLLPNYTEFKNLFDQYRILGVKLMFIPNSNVSTGLAQGTGAWPRGIPTISWVIDLDDSNPPTSVNNLLEHQRSHTRYFNKPISIFVKPRAHNTIAGSSSALLSRSQWIDFTYDTVPYYGVKVAIHVPDENPNVNSAWFTYKVITKVYFQCRHPR